MALRSQDTENHVKLKTPTESVAPISHTSHRSTSSSLGPKVILQGSIGSARPGPRLAGRMDP